MNYQSPIHVLNQVYQHDCFRPLQEEVIHAILKGDDTLALLPTGGGKSITYQIPGILLPGICIVISPLVALIKDQVASLKSKGIKALGITGGMNYQEVDEALDNGIYGNYKFLYLSPERLQQSLVKERISQMNVSLIAVDEAHCISQWGHDFRPAYRSIHKIRESHPDVPVLAVTATAVREVQQDIIESLDFKNPQIFTGDFLRKNISYTIKQTADKRAALLHFYQNHSGSSVCYIRSRKNALTYSHFLNQNGITARAYHGGLSAKERDLATQAWQRGQAQVMVATNAFGMGIDKSDVRSVIHLQLPDSIESLYQETGRAGRDGKVSKALFLFNQNDITHAKNQFLKGIPGVDDLKFIYRKLCNHLRVALGEGHGNTYYLSFSQFASTYQITPMMCYNALLALDRFSIISLTQGHKSRCYVRFRESGQKIIEHLKNQPEQNKVVQTILRTYGGSSHQKIEVNPNLIALRCGATENDVLKTLKRLKDLSFIEGVFTSADTQITFLEPRDDDRTINRIARRLKEQNEVKKNKLKQVIDFVIDEQYCIQQKFLKYFGQEEGEPCQCCSICVKEQKEYSIDSNRVIDLLKSGDYRLQELAAMSDIAAIDLSDFLKEWLDEGKLILLPTQKYRWNG